MREMHIWQITDTLISNGRRGHSNLYLAHTGRSDVLVV